MAIPYPPPHLQPPPRPVWADPKLIRNPALPEEWSTYRVKTGDDTSIELISHMVLPQWVLAACAFLHMSTEAARHFITMVQKVKGPKETLRIECVVNFFSTLQNRQRQHTSPHSKN